MRVLSVIFGLVAWQAGSVLAQTQTLVDPLGQTVVEVVTTDDLGLFTTQTLETLTGTTTATTATPTTTTTPPAQQGPVGMPPATPLGGGPTTYVYTTTDALGNIIQETDIFTPTTARTTASTTSTLTNPTILDYSQWLTMVGTNTTAVAQSGAGARWELDTFLVGSLIATLSGLLGGAWLTLV